jgi:4-alpha-glucanotransferase
LQVEKKGYKGQQRTGNSRRAGVLAHISSLPSPWGIGDIGRAAYDFLDFLKSAGQGCWQFLPLGPVSGLFGYSPYMSSSAFAGNPLLLSPELLYEDGLLARDDIQEHPDFSEYLVDFPRVERWKAGLAGKAYRNFVSGSKAKGRREVLKDFADSESWLYHYTLFEALRERFRGRPWNLWPGELARLEPAALEQALREMKETVEFHAFVQLMFQSQWKRLMQRASEAGIALFGDMPVYVAFDSADVWANQNCFQLHPVTRLPLSVAGVPPDYFSPDGQRWGNPLYRWKDGNRINSALYEWWRSRFTRLSDLLDMLRIDHFRGFEAYWSIPAGEETAVRGRWIKGPGKGFFDRVFQGSGGLEIVAEDLGTITPEVEKLRRQLGFPGMKVLQFAFDSDNLNPYLPHNFRDANCVVYTGTHDNDTMVGWYLDPANSPESKARARRYANSDGNSIHRDFIRMAYSSIAGLAMVPLQDVLGFGADCRMNIPSAPDNNWRWRCAPRFLDDSVAEYLRDEAMFYARCEAN